MKKTIPQLGRELRAMPEYEILEKLRIFEVSLDIVRGNYFELIDHIEFHNNPRESMLQLRGIENREVLHLFIITVVRLLHNYIASTFSLVDHTRKHYNELYLNDSAFPDYQSKIESHFIQNPLSSFIKDLRQYIQHYKLPGIYSMWEYKKDAPDFIAKLLLRKQDLEKFSGWKSLSIRFLSQQDEDIDLLVITKNYQTHVENFHSWLVDRQKQIHQEEIAKVDAHFKKMRKLNISILLTSLFENPSKIRNFETSLGSMYSASFFMITDYSTSNSDLAENIIMFLSQDYKFTRKEKETFRNIYKKRNIKFKKPL